MRRMSCFGFAALAPLAAVAGLASADVIMPAFEGSPIATDLAIRLDVVDHGSFAELIVSNDSAISGVLTSLYIESTEFTQAWADVSVLSASSGVFFHAGATPANPPGSIEGFGGPWGGTLFSFGADNPQPHKGVGPGQFLSVRIDPGPFGVSDVEAAYGDPSIVRFAGHVQGLPDGSSAWVSTVPAPGASVALLIGAALVVVRRRRP